MTTKKTNKNTYYQALIETPLGPMLAIADDNALYVLEFMERRALEHNLKRFCKKNDANIVPGYSKPIESIERELNFYFKKELKIFTTPLMQSGTLFQLNVWEELQKIPFGKTYSYSDISRAIGKPTAFRAVAQAVGANQLAILVPCHRVINTSGALGGYAGGISRKEWLLQHE